MRSQLEPWEQPRHLEGLFVPLSEWQDARLIAKESLAILCNGGSNVAHAGHITRPKINDQHFQPGQESVLVFSIGTVKPCQVTQDRVIAETHLPKVLFWA